MAASIIIDTLIITCICGEKNLRKTHNEIIGEAICNNCSKVYKWKVSAKLKER